MKLLKREGPEAQDERRQSRSRMTVAGVVLKRPVPEFGPSGS